MASSKLAYTSPYTSDNQTSRYMVPHTVQGKKNQGQAEVQIDANFEFLRRYLDTVVTQLAAHGVSITIDFTNLGS